MDDWQSQFIYRVQAFWFSLWVWTTVCHCFLLSEGTSQVFHNLESKTKQNTIHCAHADFFFSPTTYRHVPCCEKLLQLSLLTFVHWITRKIWEKNQCREKLLFLSKPSRIKFCQWEIVSKTHCQMLLISMRNRSSFAKYARRVCSMLCIVLMVGCYHWSNEKWRLGSKLLVTVVLNMWNLKGRKPRLSFFKKLQGPIMTIQGN